MEKYRGKIVGTNRWVYGNLIVDNKGEKFIIPSSKIYMQDNMLKIKGEPQYINQKSVSRLVMTLDNIDYYEGDIVDICSFGLNYSKEGKIEFDRGTYYISSEDGTMLEVRRVMELLDLERISIQKKKER